MSLRTFKKLLALGAACVALTACSPYVRKPQLLHPGPAGYQRYNATQFDPYPQQDVGPEIVGGRPPDFAVPPNEVERAYQHDPSGLQRGAMASPVPAGAPIFGPAPGFTPGPVFTPATPIYTPPTATSRPPKTRY